MNLIADLFFSFTKAEIFLMINQRPVDPVDIQLLIENSEERLTEAQVENLLDIVKESLPDPDPEEVDEEEEEEGEMESENTGQPPGD